MSEIKGNKKIVGKINAKTLRATTTVPDWLQPLIKENGVYVGTEEPTDPNKLVWINPDGQASEGFYTISEMNEMLEEYAKKDIVPTIYVKDASITNDILNIIKSDGTSLSFAGGKASSPTIETEEVENGVKLIITDLSGTKEVIISNGKDGIQGPAGEPGIQGPQGIQGLPGKDGADGLPGRDGVDGFSPSATVESNSDGAVITITDKDGTTTSQIYNGSNGLPGADGLDGQDGFSPTVELTDTDTGVTLTITDIGGAKTATIKNGAQGPQGLPGADGHTPVKGVDYFTESEINEIVTEAASAVNVPIATTETAGKVKPDGTTITVDADGTIHSAGGGGGGSSYTFTDGLTETDGTVSWDLNDRIIKTGQNKKGVFIRTYDSDALPQYNDGSVLIGGTITRKGPIASNCIYIGNNNGPEYQNTPRGMNAWGSCIAIGSYNQPVARDSIAIGSDNIIDTDRSSTQYPSPADNVFIGRGNSATKVKDNYGVRIRYCLGKGLEVESDKQLVEGFYNIPDENKTYCYIFGNGSDSSRSNAYTLDWSGNATFAGTVSSAGADYAEFFEWKDGNTEAEDRVGYIVTLDGDKIKLASSDDDVLGIVSGTATVLGDNAEWYWNKRWLTDDFGRVIYEEVSDYLTTDEGEKIEVGKSMQPKTNPAYDPDKPYINRRNRPEWSAVGMMGKLYVRDDGTAQVNSYVTAKDGIATHSDSKTNMRVMKRVKDNIILVCLK